MAELSLAPGAPTGAHPDCPGQIELIIDHSAGGWSSDCDLTVSLSCEWHGDGGCWWSRSVEGAVTAQTFTDALHTHQKDSVAWDAAHPPADRPTPPTT